MAEFNKSLLQQLRDHLRDIGIDGLIVGSGDAHQSEYVMSFDKRRQFISGFSGSAGTCLILQDRALLWTDGRYFLQASNELTEEWTLMKSGMPGVLELDQWVADNLGEGTVIGVDAFLISSQQALLLSDLWKKKGVVLKAIDTNPVDTLWNASGTRPSSSTNPIIIHPLKYAGVAYEEKLLTVQDYVRKNNATAILITALDEIAWLLNIRGSDIDFNPVVMSYLLVTLTKSILFVDSIKVTPDVRNHLKANLVEILPYEAVDDYMKNYAVNDDVVLADPAVVNWRLYLSLGKNVKATVSPVTLPKSLKNAAEIEGMRQSHIRDGVALTAFLCWLENHVRSSESSIITEYQVAEKIEEFRHKMPMHLYPSFETIAGYGPNGAIIHYKPKEESSNLLKKDALFLLDSGAQYLDGTTDVTRTICFGDVSDRMKECFTLVLKGHIALSSAVFPEGTLGSRLDALARLPLWSNGLDYNHGTGHGVGAFLNVHEGPQSVSFRKRDNEVGFQAGMTISNEPGYYEDGGFGVRIENILITVDANTPDHFQDRKYCKFDNLTLVPIKTELIKVKLLDSKEIQYMNDYHALVREKLMDLMKEYFPEAVDYLIRETNPISL